jgi:hypothetical protein
VAVAVADLSSSAFHPFPRSDGDNWAASSVAGVARVFLASVKVTVKAAHKVRRVTSAHGISLLTGRTLLTRQARLEGICTVSDCIVCVSPNHDVALI